MKKRVRKTQKVTIMERVTGAIHTFTIKHDDTRPVRMLAPARLDAYTKQNGGQWLTPRQAKRMRLKGQPTATPVRRLGRTEPIHRLGPTPGEASPPQ